MLDKTIALINSLFDVEFHDYNRPGNQILITSGFGLGLALMDELLNVRFFLDIDCYRNKNIDWECIGTLLSLRGKPEKIIFAGWFTIDTPIPFKNLQKGVKDCDSDVYVGGELVPLRVFIQQAQIAKLPR